MKIGDVTIKGKLVLAPMEAVTDIAFRLLCKEQGASLVYTEMINENAILRTKKLKKTITSKKERPLSLQLNGIDPNYLSKAVKKIEEKTDIIDLNLGCPSNKILKQGLGAALLKKPEKIKILIKAMVKATEKPITAKIRAGYDKRNINAEKVSEILEQAGASAIAIHPRTITQGYSGHSDWNMIKKVKETVSIPIIGNGDVTTEEKAKKMFKETKCDLVMIGRAAINDPSIFKRTKYYLTTGDKLPLPTKKDKLRLLQEYIELSEKYKINNFTSIKQRAANFTKNIKGGAKVRTKLLRTKDINSLLSLFNEL